MCVVTVPEGFQEEVIFELSMNAGVSISSQFRKHVPGHRNVRWKTISQEQASMGRNQSSVTRWH